MKGKIIGGILGAIFGGPWGAVIGASVGHFAVDNSAKKKVEFSRFLELTCMAIAKIAKADGSITQAEINEAEAIFRDLNLDEDARALAIEAFRKSKKTSYSAVEIAKIFASEFSDLNWRNVFMVSVCRVAVCDGSLNKTELDQLRQIADVLDLNLEDYISTGSRHSNAGASSTSSSMSNLDEAYAILGVSRNASNEEIKKVYHQKCKEFHPDILRSRGIGEAAIKVLEQELSRINDAYETIKKYRS